MAFGEEVLGMHPDEIGTSDQAAPLTGRQPRLGGRNGSLRNLSAAQANPAQARPPADVIRRQEPPAVASQHFLSECHFVSSHRSH